MAGDAYDVIVIGAGPTGENVADRAVGGGGGAAGGGGGAPPPPPPPPPRSATADWSPTRGAGRPGV
jgi:hypothetical protein